MEMILNAGDAREMIVDALKDVESFDFDLAREKLSLAELKIRIAHTAQTKIIQDEARGLEYPHSILFTHAQDTLMTINSEFYLSKQLVRIFETVDKRLKEVESK